MMGEVWGLIRDCGVQLSEGQSEPELSLQPSTKVSIVLKLDGFQGSLVIRKCYEDICSIIETTALARKESRFLVLGSPGIGKSYFLLYMLIHLSTRPHTAVFLNTLDGDR